MLHMLQWLYTYVASFCFQCFSCFSRLMLQVYLSECCTCFTHMFHVFYLDVAYILQWLFQAFSGVFTSVSDICCKCFNYFRMYVANVSFRCFKSRLGVASLSSFVASPRCLLLFSILVMFGQCGLTWGRAAWVRRVIDRCIIRVGGACRTEQARGVGSGVRTRSSRRMSRC
jgi:hypothetical protein